MSDFLKDYYKTKMRYYLPLFIILYTLVYYLSTKFLITNKLLIHNFDGVSTSEEIEGGHTFFWLFFGFTYVKSVLSIFVKASVISFFLSLLLNKKFISAFKVVMLSSGIYILSRALQFIYFVFFEPEKIRTLETNIFSLYAYIDHNQYGIYLLKLAYNFSLTEFAFIALLVFGFGLNNTNSTLNKTMIIVLIVDIGYIVISSLV